VSSTVVRNVAATAVAPMAWGSTYLVTTEFLPAGRPFLAGTLRSLGAGLILVLLAHRPNQNRGTAKSASPQSPFPQSLIWWFRAITLGVLNIGAFFAMLFGAAYRLPGGIAAAVGAIQPLVAVSLAAVIIKERPRRLTMVSVVVGVIAVVVLVTRNTQQLDSLGLVLAFGGAVSMATGVTLTKHWGRPVELLTFTSWQLLAGGAFLLPLVLVFEGLPSTLTLRNVMGYLWLASVGGALAYSLWFRGIALLPVVATSVLGALSPVVAALLGWLVLEQHLSALQGIAAMVILGSVLVTQLTAARPTASSSQATQD
jgi:probable blue pigment (indigoidine) exporter